MKKIYIIIASFFLLSSFVILDTYKTGGAHPSSTGAPGEGTCADATTGCHANATVKSDSISAVNTLLFPTSDSSYVPGNTYTITVKAEKTGIKKFGFEIVALKNSDKKNIGTWIITDATRTHTLTGSGVLADRKYVTHSVDGTPAVSAGLGQWSFKWTAPSTNAGNITFYYSTNCTNDDQANTGDQLFLSSFRIHPAANASVKNALQKSKYSVVYLKDSRILKVNYSLIQDANTALSIYDMQGKLIQSFSTVKRTIGRIEDLYSLNNALSKGIYLINMTVNDQLFTEKIMVQ